MALLCTKVDVDLYAAASTYRYMRGGISDIYGQSPNVYGQTLNVYKQALFVPLVLVPNKSLIMSAIMSYR
jgi:hypothetical protein